MPFICTPPRLCRPTHHLQHRRPRLRLLQQEHRPPKSRLRQDGAPEEFNLVEGATVTLTNRTTQVSQQQKVGKSGDYNFVELQPATYTISVAAAGFRTVEQQAELLVSQPATINFKMTVGSTAETIEVTASSTINFSDASLGNAIDNAQIEAMPIDSRNVADLLSLQPDVLYFGNNNSSSNPAANNDSRLGAVAGARSDQGNITLDGLDDNDQTF